jgi:hypothetical protein
MIGHQPLIELRKQGRKPSMVFLTDFDCLPVWQTYNDAPEICIAKDQPFLCDFRFLSGLSVSITASSKERAIKFYEHCKQSGAVIVASTFCNDYSWKSYFAFYNKQTNFEKIQDDL